MHWKILWPFSSHSGIVPLLPAIYLVTWCLTMCQHIGTHRLTCSTLPSSFAQPLTWWPQCATLISRNTSYPLKSGTLPRNFKMFWRYLYQISSMSLLNAFLEIFKDVMLFFSRGTPNLTTVIPAMDHIDNTLATKSDSSQFSLPIWAALVIGKNTINMYYSKTDHSEVYRIAMSKYIHAFFSAFISNICSPASWIVLHPQHKLAYFKTQGWEDDWIETAYNLVHEEFCYISIGLHLPRRSIGLLSSFSFLLPIIKAHVQYRSDSEALYDTICGPLAMYDTI